MYLQYFQRGTCKRLMKPVRKYHTARLDPFFVRGVHISLSSSICFLIFSSKPAAREKFSPFIYTRQVIKKLTEEKLNSSCPDSSLRFLFPLYSALGRSQRRVLLPCVDQPAPSPPESLGATMRGGVPGPSAGGHPLTVVPLLAVDPGDGSWSSSRVRYSLRLSDGGVFVASSGVGRMWLLSLRLGKGGSPVSSVSFARFVRFVSFSSAFGRDVCPRPGVLVLPGCRPHR
jgi:hypothetical protein